MINAKTRKRIQQKIAVTYVPLKELIFEDNEREVDIIRNFTDYSYVLAGVELIIHSFITANPETKDQDILDALQRVRSSPLHEFSHSEEDALAFTITYGVSRALQQKRLAINEIHALLDWLIYEVEGRIESGESYIVTLRKFLNDSLNKIRTDDKSFLGGKEERGWYL